MKFLMMLALAAVGCDTVDDRPASWSYLHAAIIEPSCATANCHSKIASTAALDLSDREYAYTVLLGSICGHPSDHDAPGNYVFPYHPERSKLLHVLRGDADLLMPPDQPLPDAEIELVDRWILEGATCE